jgi:hypothetical protein
VYGTTAFAGTINVIHYTAGKSEGRAGVAYGAYGSLEGSASATLLDGRIYRASISVDGFREHYSDPRSGADRAHWLFRNAADLGGGEGL